MLTNIHGKWRAGLLLSGLLVVLSVAGAFVFHLGTTPQVSASAALWPTAASPGSTILVTGKGLPAQERVQVYFQTPDRGTVAALTNASGSFSVPLTVPSAYMPGTQYYVHVNSDVYSTQMLFNFAKPNISLTNATMQPTFGSLTSFTGVGFTPNERINLVWSYETGSTLNAGTAVAGSDGSFNTMLTMPSIPHLTQCKLIATGSKSGFSSSLPLTGIPAILFDPSDAPAGTVIHVTAGSFASNETVNVTFKGVSVATVKADELGAFTTSFSEPDTQTGFTGDAIIAAGNLSREAAKGGFTVDPKITVTVQPLGGNLVKITVIGSHFRPRSKVVVVLVLKFAGSSLVKIVTLGPMTADRHGNFKLVATVDPPLTGPGTVVAQESGTGLSGKARVTIP